MKLKWDKNKYRRLDPYGTKLVYIDGPFEQWLLHWQYKLQDNDLFPENELPYARHYNPRFVFILPHFSLRFIFKSGLYCREVSNYMIFFSSKVATKN